MSESKFCSQCGNGFKDNNDMFCTKCGTPRDNIESAPLLNNNNNNNTQFDSSIIPIGLPVEYYDSNVYVATGPRKFS